MTPEKHNVKDPVCGAEIKPKEVQDRSNQNGKTYYFCSTDCKVEFEKNPRSYTEKVA